MNQSNTIKSMIPQRILELVPSQVRDNWADHIVAKVKEHNPILYAAVGQWNFIPDEELNMVVNEIMDAAEKIHLEIRNGTLHL